MNKLYPSFPLNCCACEAEHSGYIDQAIEDGWNVSVFETKSDGLIQFAGCPSHFKEMQDKSLAFIRSKRQQN